MFMRFLSRSLFSSSSGNLDLLSNSRVFFPKLVPSSLLEQMLFCTISLYFFLFSTYHGGRLDSHLNLRKYSEPPHPPPLDKISGTVCNFHNKIFLAKFLHYQFWNKIHLYTHIFLFFCTTCYFLHKFHVRKINPFSTNVPLKDKQGSSFLLAKCLKNTCGRVTF